jgi:8-oxo-dGTP pyrophosphatase MutT (NUDIX family)
MADRARAHDRGEIETVPTRDAATVVLLRDAATGIEAFLLRRVGTMAFAAGMYVFPGGRVDPDDARTETGWVGPPPDTLTGPLSADLPTARALVCAAVRETFEESGVLLAGSDAGHVVDPVGPEWEEDRRALEAREQSIASLLCRRGLVLRTDLLRPWAHWITPEPEPKRYDTRFFVAALPAGQVTRDVGGESDRTVWMTPRAALASHADGELAMLPPTAFTLAEIAEYPDVAAVLQAAAKRDVKPVLPRIVVSGDEAALLLPHEEGYRQDGAE